MKKPEKHLAIALLAELAKRIEAEGSNDLLLPDTLENADLIERAEAWNYDLSKKKWLKCADYHPLIRDDDGHLVTNNLLLCEFLRSRLEGEVEDETDCEETDSSVKAAFTVIEIDDRQRIYGQKRD